MQLNQITGSIIDSAMRVHTALGPGLLESAYEACLVYELNKRQLDVRTQMMLPIRYEGQVIDTGYRIDLLVANEIIVELKSVDDLKPIHKAQVLSYLRLSNKCIGLLINFNVLHLKGGIKRIVNGYEQ